MKKYNIYEFTDSSKNKHIVASKNIADAEISILEGNPKIELSTVKLLYKDIKVIL